MDEIKNKYIESKFYIELEFYWGKWVVMAIKGHQWVVKNANANGSGEGVDNGNDWRMTAVM